MASARKKGTSENIKTYGAAGFGRDYTVLQTWEDAYTIDCVAGTTSPVLECYDDAASFNDYVLVFGATTNATYFRIIRPGGTKASGWQGHDGTPNNGVSFFCTTDAVVFSITEQYSQVQDIIAKLIPAATAGRNTFNLGNTLVGTIGCIAFNGTSTGAISGFNINNTSLCVDCLAHNNTGFGFNVSLFGALTGIIYNCDSLNNGTYGFRMQGNNASAAFLIENCLGNGNTTADFFDSTTNSPTRTVIYCSSGDATADDWAGAGCRINQSANFVFVNSGNDDFHLASTDTGAKDFGTDLSGDATYPFNDDIDFQTRSGNWDIGFDEYVAGGETITVDKWHPEIQQPVKEKIEIIGY